MRKAELEVRCCLLDHHDALMVMRDAAADTVDARDVAGVRRAPLGRAGPASPPGPLHRLSGVWRRGDAHRGPVRVVRRCVAVPTAVRASLAYQLELPCGSRRVRCGTVLGSLIVRGVQS